MREINEYVEDVLLPHFKKDNNLDYPPIKVEKIIKTLGGEIIIDQAQFEEKFESGEAGIEKNDDRFTIYLPEAKRYSKNRKRFDLAHELGHLILHLRFFKKEIWEKWDNKISFARNGELKSGDIRKQFNEYEANEFAGALLMPAEAFLKDYFELKKAGKNHKDIIKKLAKKFDVSQHAADIRHKRLFIAKNLI